MGILFVLITETVFEPNLTLILGRHVDNPLNRESEVRFQIFSSQKVNIFDFHQKSINKKSSFTTHHLLSVIPINHKNDARNNLCVLRTLIAKFNDEIDELPDFLFCTSHSTSPDCSHINNNNMSLHK